MRAASHLRDHWLKDIPRLLLINTEFDLLLVLSVAAVGEGLVQIEEMDLILVPDEEVAVVHYEIFVGRLHRYEELQALEVDLVCFVGAPQVAGIARAALEPRQEAIQCIP